MFQWATRKSVNNRDTAWLCIAQLRRWTTWEIQKIDKLVERAVQRHLATRMSYGKLRLNFKWGKFNRLKSGRRCCDLMVPPLFSKVTRRLLSHHIIRSRTMKKGKWILLIIITRFQSNFVMSSIQLVQLFVRPDELMHVAWDDTLHSPELSCWNGIKGEQSIVSYISLSFGQITIIIYKILQGNAMNRNIDTRNWMRSKWQTTIKCATLR